MQTDHNILGFRPDRFFHDWTDILFLYSTEFGIANFFSTNTKNSINITEFEMQFVLHISHIHHH